MQDNQVVALLNVCKTAINWDQRPVADQAQDDQYKALLRNTLTACGMDVDDPSQRLAAQAGACMLVRLIAAAGVPAPVITASVAGLVSWLEGMGA